MDNSNILTHSNYHQQPWKPNIITSPVVDFRINGEKNIRRYDGSKGLPFNNSSLAVEKAQDFVNYHCRAFCVMDGANIRKIKQILQPAACDWFIQRPEWEMK